MAFGRIGMSLDDDDAFAHATSRVVGESCRVARPAPSG
jgi:hypothetical protein